MARRARTTGRWPLPAAAIKAVLPFLSLALGFRPAARKSWTALMSAAYEGHLPVVEALLAKGAEVNAKDLKGETALSIAQKQGHTKIVEVLRQAGAE